MTNRFTITSDHTQGENWHYIHDGHTGGIVDLHTDLSQMQEMCKALNDGRKTVPFRKISNFVSMAAREIGGAL